MPSISIVIYSLKERKKEKIERKFGKEKKNTHIHTINYTTSNTSHVFLGKSKTESKLIWNVNKNYRKN